MKPAALQKQPQGSAEVLRPDLCVIGAGAGGLSVAVAAAAFGVPVVLIEKNRMGGECLNSGCVPSKALRASALRAHLARTASAFGIAAPPQVMFAEVMAHVRAVVATVGRNDTRERLEGLGVRVIEAAARFADARTVVAGGVTIRARRFVIATGSSPAIPAIPGLASVPYLTNETVFDLSECPRHLVVIGGGTVGLGLAQSLHRLGAGVTVLDAAPLLDQEDPECADVLIAALMREGMALHGNVAVEGVRTTAGGVAVTYNAGGRTHEITGSHLLVTTGRTPNTDGLGLDAAGIAVTPSGITVDAGLRTSNRRVYAIGDVNGLAQFTYAANDQAGLVLRSALFRLPVNVRKRVLPWIVDTDPSLARVGLTERQARAQGHAIRVARWPYRENDRAQVDRIPHGHVKVVTTLRGRILGVTIVGVRAEDMIGPWALAMANGLDMRAMAAQVVPYPTLAETGKRAAMSFFAPALTSLWVRRIIRWLRQLG